METKLYRINGTFAKANNLPVYFAANKLKESARGVYLYGHFTTETTNMGVCCRCARTLTHPVSIVLGIGPECGGHYWDWDLVGGYTMENVERLKREIGSKMKDIVIDQWFPRSIIREIKETPTVVLTPANHPMIAPQVPVTSARRATLVKYQTSGMDAIKIEFPYNPEDLVNVKTLADRRFHNEGSAKYWTAAYSLESIEKLNQWGFSLDASLRAKLTAPAPQSASNVPNIIIPGLRGELFPFQNKGVSFIESRNGRALIADEMGLGKTVQALAWLQLHPEKRPVIVVVPASLKLNWAKEIMKWVEHAKVQILTGTNPNTPIIGEIIIINYDILPYWVTVLTQIRPQVIITDECHYYKNNAAKRTKAVKELGKHAPHFIALSGTPIVNRPVEAYNAIKLIDGSIAPNFFTFAKRYCGARHNGYGWDFSGATNTQELNEKLTRTIMIRRKKADVLQELPAKMRSFLPMELSNEKDYRTAERDFISYIRVQRGAASAARASNAETLTRIEILKQLAVAGKLQQAVDWIKNFLEVDGKLVVFAVHRFVIDSLMEAFPGQVVKIDGSVSMEERNRAVASFQNDPQIRLFIGNIKAAGVGLTLTAASNVAILELPWTPGELVQAEDRCHRIGQKDSVTIHYLLATGTIEEKIATIIDKKRQVLDSVLDGTMSSEESLLSQLMEEYGQE